MSLVFITAILTITFDLFVSIYVLLQKNRNFTSKILLSLSFLSLCGWGTTQSINHYYESSAWTVYPMRLGYTFVALAIIFFYFFITSYVLPRRSRINIIPLILVIFLVLIITIPPFIVPDVKYKENIALPNTNIKFVIIYTTLIIFYIINIGRKVLLTYKTTRNSAIKTSMYLLVISLGAVAFLGIIFNIIIPLIIETSPKTSPLIGFISSFLFSSTSSYIFSRSRYSNAKVYLNKILYSTALSFLAFLTFHLVYVIQTHLWSSLYSTSATISGILFAFLFILVVNEYIGKKLKDISTNIFDLYEQNSNKFKQQFIQEVALTTGYVEIYNVLLKFMGAGLSEGQEFFLLLKESPNNYATFGQAAVSAIKSERDFLNIITQLESTLSRYEIYSISEALLNTKNYTNEMYPHLQTLQDNNIELIQSLKDKEKLLGYLVFFQKVGGIAYYEEEIRFIHEIASLVVLAISKIQLYEKERSFNIELKKEIDEATKELQFSNAKLSESLRKERDMMDVLGHELRTPLSIARNAILMMEMAFKSGRPLDAKEMAHLVEKAKENIKREVSLLESVLSSTRIENKRMQINFTVVEMNDVVNDTMDGFLTQAQGKGLQLTANVPDKKLYCWGGREQMQEVLDNLVSNAVKYTPQGSVTITLGEEGEFNKLSVADTGMGIPKEEIPNLGKKFHRVNTYLAGNDKGNTNIDIVRPGGTGIGLYVVFGLVELMKGTIHIDSDLGKGSTFTVRIPKYTNQDKLPPEPQSEVQPRPTISGESEPSSPQV